MPVNVKKWATEHGYERGWQLDLADPEEIRPVLTLARPDRHTGRDD